MNTELRNKMESMGMGSAMDAMRKQEFTMILAFEEQDDPDTENLINRFNGIFGKNAYQEDVFKMLNSHLTKDEVFNQFIKDRYVKPKKKRKKKPPKPKYECMCNDKITNTPSSITKHMISKKHINAMNRKNKI